MYDPTPKHALLDEHDTLASSPPPPSLSWIDHVRPFQRSTNGPGCPVPTGGHPPTAMQNVLEVHDTPVSAPRALGVGWAVQLEPFQRSARARKLPSLSMCDPAAMQNDLDGHDTAESCPVFRTGWGTA
jgi:hypothetical protein